MTLVARPIPPTPPQSTDGHPLPEESFQGPGTYRAVCINMQMSGEISGQEIHYGSPPFYTVPGYPHMPPQSIMSGQVTTPPPVSDEDLVPMGSPTRTSSPAWSRSPSSRAKTPVRDAPVRAARQRRNRNRRELSDSGIQLEGPISQLTESFHTTPIKDMDAWVSRSASERQDEVRKKNGKISRPMNSFMLYRSAYAERTKRLVGANNHQIVSKIAGQGWKLEPVEIRRKYEDLAKLERDNHAATHPNYKFSPNKAATTASRRDSGSPALTPGHVADEGGFSDMESDLGSTTYRGSPYAHSRSQSFEEAYYDSSRDSSPFGPDSMMTPGYIHPSWQNTSHPSGLPMMQPTESYGDMHYRSNSPQQDMGYGSSLAGLPGATHHELLQPQLTHSHGLPMHDMDPRLLSNGESGVSAMSAPSYANPGSYTWADETPTGYYTASSAPAMSSGAVSYAHSSMTSAYLPSMQSLEGRDPSWDMVRHESMADPTSSEFEMWCSTEPNSNNY
ncbi:transcriptional regulator family: HMG [Penicillium roqueforti]|uniref:transcriptional regulator family: HMG n=1 Tax=Penicillium roqueforti TaxID=5082 RepID=UPI00190CE2AB|nr:transcriptional regulator family: HMG [Penicillium roqueforti]KAF9250133.1 transcriptional regulator family: HMG [Penicillium roqueforti]KAI2679584.1 transcriptional regulator family: HMG [Penicillium roqueforti]KAI2730580.1 transcriptional regulator family: HMG [Penicillium roqueforti]KAI3103592.1 transcriptional regulator family: HMG [Penicillium roqueforti]KAI3109949.1 transcriptional regulator family: HMG [Penicillium roqueforti]